MPLFEKEASVDTACISTAPVFKDARKGQGVRQRKSQSTGGASAQKKPDDPVNPPRWWALQRQIYDEQHLRQGIFSSPNFVSALWAVWAVFGVVAGILTPTEYICSFMVGACVFGTAAAMIPDSGETVLPYYIHVHLALIIVKCLLAGGLWTFAPFLYVFGYIPVADYVVGVELTNQSPEVQHDLHRAFRFKFLTLTVPPTAAAMYAFGCWYLNNHESTTLEFIGFCCSIGLYTGAIGITVAHELCHKASHLERFCGRALMCLVTYGHFYVEHTLGHHKLVATDDDPATARYGESFWSFLPRVVYGEFMSAYHIEKARLKKKKLPFWENQIPVYFMFSMLICIGSAIAFGNQAIPFFVGQSTVGILLFESVNYLEHYGLERRQDPKTGRYEPVQPRHSWDSPAKLTNMILIKLQRHADHHAHAGKRFQTLQLFEESPQLPSGYATMILLALIPPVWRAVMHPRLMAFRATQKGQVWRHGPQPTQVE